MAYGVRATMLSPGHLHAAAPPGARTRTSKTPARERVEAWRERRRSGRLLIPVEIGPRQMAGLERLGLLAVGERDKTAIAWAVTRYLDSAAPVAAVGDAIWPADEDGLAA